MDLKFMAGRSSTRVSKRRNKAFHLNCTEHTFEYIKGLADQEDISVSALAYGLLLAAIEAGLEPKEI